jgi:hypothetical protein
LSRFTFSFSFSSTKYITDSMTRCPARLLPTKMLR